mmetsp:Transcript_17524/g.46409  ORF Transcript_17524/g.46409 Transcript_17524/m.46409 type:complete len:211 (+) Transcript_17524:342-974(+)
MGGWSSCKCQMMQDPQAVGRWAQTSGSASGLASGLGSGLALDMPSGLPSGSALDTASETASGLPWGLASETASGLASGVPSDYASGSASGVPSGYASGSAWDATSKLESGLAGTAQYRPHWRRGTRSPICTTLNLPRNRNAWALLMSSVPKPRPKCQTGTTLTATVPKNGSFQANSLRARIGRTPLYRRRKFCLTIRTSESTGRRWWWQH